MRSAQSGLAVHQSSDSPQSNCSRGWMIGLEGKAGCLPGWCPWGPTLQLTWEDHWPRGLVPESKDKLVDFTCKGGTMCTSNRIREFLAVAGLTFQDECSRLWFQGRDPSETQWVQRGCPEWQGGRDAGDQGGLSFLICFSLFVCLFVHLFFFVCSPSVDLFVLEW